MIHPPRPHQLLILLLIIILGLLLVLKIKTPQPTLPAIISEVPANQSSGVLENASIYFKFASPLTSSQQSRLQVSISPTVPVTLSWSAPNELVVAPNSPWKTNTSYQILLKYQSGWSHTLNFSTNQYTNQELKTQIQTQIEDDYQFSQAYNQMIQTKPWLTQLPYDAADYAIVYDFTKKLFRIRLKSTVTVQAERQRLTTQALEVLQNFGLDKNLIKYEVLDPLP